MVAVTDLLVAQQLKRLPQPLSTRDPMLMLFLTVGEEAGYDPRENRVQSK